MEAAWSVSLLFSCLGNLLADRLHMLQVCCWGHQGGEFGTFTTALGSNRGVASALASHVVPLTRSHGEVDVNKMEVSMVLQHAVATCLTGRTRLFWSRWEGRLGQHVISPPHRELEVTFYISVGSSMPANISLKPPSAAGMPFSLIVVVQLGCNHRDFKSHDWWVCEQFRRPKTRSVNPSHDQIICSKQCVFEEALHRLPTVLTDV